FSWPCAPSCCSRAAAACAPPSASRCPRYRRCPPCPAAGIAPPEQRGDPPRGANISAHGVPAHPYCGVKVSDIQPGLTPAQAATMLKLQDRLNSIINPDWIGGGARFLRAAFVESAEALEHHGWKWWKKQSIDLPQVQMELIDILHFYLSHTLVSAGGSAED